MTFQIITFGCRLNQAESDQISADLILAGFEPYYSRRARVSGTILPSNNPHFIVLNVCAVTHKAVREARQKVAQVKRQYPDSKIIVIGCVDEWNWKEVDFWIKNRDKNKLLELLKKEIRNWKLEIRKDKIKEVENQRVNSRTRAFIKIQDGCDNYCTYCVVPFMRGKPKNRGVDKIIQDIQDKEKQGYKEVVLTGVNIGLYVLKGLDLVRLLEIILPNTQIERIRLSSIWPTHLTSQLINLMAENPRICPHIHLSIQAGSDKILKSMGRDYIVKDIIRITNQAKKRIAKINFTCDLIVGFPGETDQDFQDSCKLIEKIGSSKVHVFKYSKRPGTRAAKMKGQISDKIKRARSRELVERAEAGAKKVKEGFVGQEFDVLWEEKKAGFWYGFTDNYIRVRKKVGQIDLKNTIDQIRLSKKILFY